jgi:hypothetical protein
MLLDTEFTPAAANKTCSFDFMLGNVILPNQIVLDARPLCIAQDRGVSDTLENVACPVERASGKSADDSGCSRQTLRWGGVAECLSRTIYPKP